MESDHPYCTYCNNLPMDDPDRIYHDHHYGFPIDDDDELFGRLLLEIQQAGLSWRTILKKEEGFRRAYGGFSIARVAAFDEEDLTRLLSDASIIRNRLKIKAVIHNARIILELQKQYGSFSLWLEAHLGYTKEQWVRLFKKTFKFTGGEITGEFLMSIGYLPGAHGTGCRIYEKIVKREPKWMQTSGENTQEGQQ